MRLALCLLFVVVRLALCLLFVVVRLALCLLFVVERLLALCLLFVVERLLLVAPGVQTNNDVGDKGACGLGEGLKSNRSLKSLYLVSWRLLCVF